MKIKQTKPNIWKFTKDDIDFTFRFWEDDLRLLNPEDDNNASLKFTKCNLQVARQDYKIDEAILKNKKKSAIFLEHLANTQIRWLSLKKNPHHPRKGYIG